MPKTPRTPDLKTPDPKPKDGEPLAYRLPDACKALGLSRATLYLLIKSGDLLTFTQGRRRLVSKTALEAYIARREAAELATLPVATPPATLVYPLSPSCQLRSSSHENL